MNFNPSADSWHNRQALPVFEVAANPAPLNQYGAGRVFKQHRCDDIKTRLGIHLAVVKKYGFGCGPRTAQLNCSVHGIKRIHGVDQRSVVKHSTLALRNDGSLQVLLLGRTGELPAAQRKREQDTCQRGYRDQPKLQTLTHGIIWPMKYFAILGFVGIIGALGSALFFMMRGSSNDQQKSSNMFLALALRVGFSILLFACILVAWKLGYIKPTGIPTGG